MLQKFYHSTIRKAVVSFGNLFNNILIDRLDSSGNASQTIKVPLSYAPKQKFIARIEALPTGEGERTLQTKVPRMAFEMLSVEYDPTRRVSLLQQNRTINTTSTSVNTQYAPSPYNIQMGLYVYVKNQDDGLQILEQILPYFNPDFNLTINAVPQLGIKNDLPIVLDTVSYEDQYEGDFADRRAIIWTLTFTLKLNFYGPITRAGIIRSVNVDTYNDNQLTQRIQTYTVTPDPVSANVGSLTGFIETFEDF